MKTKNEILSKQNYSIPENIINFFTTSPVVGWSGLPRKGKSCPASSMFRSLEAVHIKQQWPNQTNQEIRPSSAHDYALIASESIRNFPILIRSPVRPVHIDVFFPDMVFTAQGTEYEHKYSQSLESLFDEATDNLTSALINSFLRGDAPIPAHLELDKRQKFCCILLLKIAREIEQYNKTKHLVLEETSERETRFRNWQGKVLHNIRANSDKLSHEQDEDKNTASSLAQPPESQQQQNAASTTETSQQPMETTSACDSGLDDIFMSDTSDMSVNEDILDFPDSSEDELEQSSLPHLSFGTATLRPKTPPPVITLSSDPETITPTLSPTLLKQKPRMAYTEMFQKPEEPKKEETLSKMLQSANTGLNDKVI